MQFLNYFAESILYLPPGMSINFADLVKIKHKLGGQVACLRGIGQFPIAGEKRASFTVTPTKIDPAVARLFQIDSNGVQSRF